MQYTAVKKKCNASKIISKITCKCFENILHVCITFSHSCHGNAVNPYVSHSFAASSFLRLKFL